MKNLKNIRKYFIILIKIVKKKNQKQIKVLYIYENYHKIIKK